MSETETETKGQKRITVLLTLGALILGALGFFTFGLSALIALVLGMVALILIRKGSGRLTVCMLAILGMCLSTLSLIRFFYHDYRSSESDYRIMCQGQLGMLGESMLLYTSDYDDQYPTADKWCDLLMMYSEGALFPFICPTSDDKKGESSYAMNKNVVGKRVSEIPEDVVVLFETNLGKNPLGRQALLAERDWHKFFDYPDSGKKVYKLRWNQFGGPEILTTENHKGKGCNILFNDLHVEFVKKERLGELKWEVEEKE